MRALTLRDPARLGLQVASFNPLTLFTWVSAYWASDPNWTNPADGAAIVAFTSGAANEGWRDGSGNGHPVYPVAPASLYRAASNINSKPAVEIPTNGYLNSVAVTASSQPLTAIVICYHGSIGAAGNVFSGGNDVVFFASGDKPSIYAGSTVSAVAGAAATSYAIRGYLNGASSAVTANGVTATGNPGSGTSGTKYTLGGFNGGTGVGWAGQIAFAGFYAGDITANANWATFVSGVSSYYGLTIS